MTKITEQSVEEVNLDIGLHNPYHDSSEKKRTPKTNKNTLKLLQAWRIENRCVCMCAKDLLVRKGLGKQTNHTQKTK